jgi:catechol 2,3-dioxygenase-like lactoylglutathione lyase family enzyme
MAIPGIDTMAVVVADGRNALRWYRDVLGLDVAYVGPKEPGSNPSTSGHPVEPDCWIEMDPRRPRTRLHLCELGGQTEPGPTGVTPVTPSIHADHARLAAQGVRFLSAPKLTDRGNGSAGSRTPMAIGSI